MIRILALSNVWTVDEMNVMMNLLDLPFSTPRPRTDFDLDSITNSKI